MTDGKLLLADVQVPVSLVAKPAAFGGRHQGDCLAGDLLIEDGVVRGFASSPVQTVQRIDLSGRIILPKLVEAHCHLDKCHTIDRIGAVGGDLMSAIESQARDKAHWTKADLRRRASRGLNELQGAGCDAVRSHVDWGDDPLDPPPSWHVLRELAVEWRDRLTLQVAPLVNLDLFEDEDVSDRLARLVADGSGVIGAFVLFQDRKADKLRRLFSLADRYGLALDFHVDESLDPACDGLDTIADVAIETGFQGPMLCGHACSLMNSEGDALTARIDRVARAGLSVVALPTTNLFLQGRCEGTPERRGLTRVGELFEAGVNVVFGSDNVCDAFCPGGRHDPMNALALGSLVGHLDAPMGRWLPSVATNASRSIGIVPTFVDGVGLKALNLSPARHTAELMAGMLSPLQDLADGLGAPGLTASLDQPARN